MKRVAIVQMSSTNRVAENLNTVTRRVAESVAAGAKCVVLPENVAFLGTTDRDKLEVSEQPGEGPIQACFSALARQYGIWLVGGTIPIREASQDKVFASCWVWDNQGQVVARYDKIHLFDVELSSTDCYYESQTIQPGNQVVCVDSPLGKMGLSVCYDLRFADLYMALSKQGAELLMVPSAFTAVTGKAHWEPLLRARAIENLCYVLAPNQTGIHVNGKASYGHSMIIDPWGKPLALQEAGEGILLADIDLAYLSDLRSRFPVLQHRKTL